MTIWRWVRAGVLALVLGWAVVGAGPVWAEEPALPVAVEGRAVLLDWAGEAEHALAFDAPAGIEAQSFGLLIAPEDTTRRPIVHINGVLHASVPIANGPHALYQIIGTQLSPGAANTIEIRDEEGAPQPVTRALLFSLLDSFEEAHFNRAFGPAEVTRRAQPPLHPSQNNYDVQHYTIELDVTMNSTRNLVGKVTIESQSLVNGLSQAAYDFDWSSNPTSVVAVPAIAGMTWSYDSANDWVIVNFPVGSRPNTGEDFTIEIQYNGAPPLSSGAFGLRSYDVTSQPNGKPVAWTFSEPYSARSWWPCKDLAADKAFVDLHITVPDPNIVVSNGVLVSTTPAGGGKTTYHWSHGYPISTYLVAFCATEYLSAFDDYTSIDGNTTMPVGHYVFQTSANELNALPDTLDVLQHFANLFGEYPFLDEKYVTMTWGGGFGMEHTTCTSINNGNLGTSEGGKSRRNVHELAHMWFGDQVTPPIFDHLWLNEGWATYCEALYREYDNGIADYHAAVAGFISSGISNTTPLVYSGADAFTGSVVYRRGAIVLHMLRHVLGDEAFFQGARNYLESFAYGTVDTEDFKAEMEAASGMDLTSFFNSWVYGINRPNYQWSMKRARNRIFINISQTQAQAPFQMPIDIRVNYVGGGSETFVIQNTQRHQSFIIETPGKTVNTASFDPDNWIYKTVATGAAGPGEPILQSVRALPGGNVQATWLSAGGSTTGFRLFASDSMQNWDLVANESVLGAGATSHTFTPGTLASGVYVAVQAVDSNGLASAWSDVYSAAAGIGARGAAHFPILVVDGYDRWNTQNRGVNHPFAAWHGAAISANGFGHDSCANEALGAIALGDYAAVVWVLGEESTADRTFDAAEQALVQAYLEAGGRLFVSGAEVGWDIGRAASPNYSPGFYNNYLKAIYIADDSSGIYTATREAGVPFSPATIAIDDGTGGIYFAQWLDVIAPTGGSQKAYGYSASLGAAVYYEGTFGSGTEPGKLFYMGFPFETIVSESDRIELMGSVLTQQFFPGSEETRVDGWMVF